MKDKRFTFPNISTCLFLLSTIGVLALVQRQSYMQIPIALLAAFLLLFLDKCWRVLHIKVPQLLGSFISWLIFASLVLGEAFDYYAKYANWDNILHLLAGLLLGSVGWWIFSFRPYWGIITFSLFGSSIWEMMEYSFDRLIGTNMQKDALIRPPLFQIMKSTLTDGVDIGLYDTMTDLFFGLLGGILMLLFFLFLPKFSRQNLLPQSIKETTEDEA